MTLRALLENLSHFPKCKSKALSLFQQLSISDLGYYFFTESHYSSNIVIPRNTNCSFSVAHKISDTSFFSKSIYSSTLFHNSKVILCWFLLPPGTLLALHDHPAMEVYQKVLFGELEILEIEANNSSFYEGGSGRLLTRNISADSSCNSTNDLPTPRTKLFHEVRNNRSTSALFIDLICPPYYTPPLYLPCTYFTASRNESDKLSSSSSGIEENVKDGDELFVRPRFNYIPTIHDLCFVRM